MTQAAADTISRKSAGRKQTPKALATRRHILDCAAGVFARNGYKLTRLRDIADAAGLHLTALYYHYDNKEALARDLIMAAASQRSAALRGALEDLPPEAPYRMRIATANRAYLGQLLQDNPLMRAAVAIIGQVSPEVRDEVLELTRGDSEVWRRLLVEAQRVGEIAASVDIDMVRMLLIGSMNWAIEWFDPERSSPDRLAFALNRMLFEGISD
jgi:AcrR family transcriptional regulator